MDKHIKIEIYSKDLETLKKDLDNWLITERPKSGIVGYSDFSINYLTEEEIQQVKENLKELIKSSKNHLVNIKKRLQGDKKELKMITTKLNHSHNVELHSKEKELERHINSLHDQISYTERQIKRHEVILEHPDDNQQYYFDHIY